MLTLLTRNKKNEKNNTKKAVKFSLKVENAGEVILVGDFNNWNPDKHKMKHNGNGTWEKKLIFSPGTYEYKFCVDNNWMEDPENNLTCLNCFGTQNSVLTLSL